MTAYEVLSKKIHDVEKGLLSCEDRVCDIHYEILDAMEEYAKQKCIEQRELCASHAKLLHHDGRSKKDKVLSSRIYTLWGAITL